jgi:hypothetical protein
MSAFWLVSLVAVAVSLPYATLEARPGRLGGLLDAGVTSESMASVE